MKLLEFKKPKEEQVKPEPCAKIVEALESHLEDAKQGKTNAVVIFSRHATDDVRWCFLSAERHNPGPMLKSMDMLKTEIHLELNARAPGMLLYDLLQKLGVDIDEIP